MKCELSWRPTWFSFQVSRQFLLSHFLAPLCLIITLIMFSDRITTVGLNTSLYLLCWPSVLQVWPPWCPRCPPPLQPLTASWLRATSTPASPTSPATSTSGRRLIGLSVKNTGKIFSKSGHFSGISVVPLQEVHPCPWANLQGSTPSLSNSKWWIIEYFSFIFLISLTSLLYSICLCSAWYKCSLY